MLDSLLSVIAPHICLQCGAEGSPWCVACRNTARPAIDRCYRCHALSPRGRTCGSCRASSALYSVRAVTRYDGIAKQLVWRFKFERARAAYRVLADMLMQRAPAEAGAVVVPVPTSTSRVRQRGYDQTVLIARQYARSVGLPYRPVLARYGQQQQHTAARQQRLTQLQRAFTTARPAAVQSMHVLLIDDVVTTGATLEAAAQALKAAGAKRVSALVFAQA